MSDNISRHAVIQLIYNSYYNLAESSEDVDSMIEDVEDLPSTDRTGHWIAEASDKILGQLNWSCSECGEGFALDIGKCPSDIGMNYCTNCGADMRGVDDESTL